MSPLSAAEKFRLILQRDPRYDPEAYNFLYEALDFTLKNVVAPRGRANQHVTGRELLEGVRRYGIDQFGCLAKEVFRVWGINRTDDIGEMVFNLVDQDLMGKQESDTKEDFQGIYDFEEVFDLKPVLSYTSDRGEWKASYITRRHKKRKRRKIEHRE